MLTRCKNCMAVKLSVQCTM